MFNLEQDIVNIEQGKQRSENIRNANINHVPKKQNRVVDSGLQYTLKKQIGYMNTRAK